jgi:hypothetical protein
MFWAWALLEMVSVEVMDVAMTAVIARVIMVCRTVFMEASQKSGCSPSTIEQAPCLGAID